MLIHYAFFEDFFVDPDGRNISCVRNVYDRKALFKLSLYNGHYTTTSVPLPTDLSEFDLFEPQGVIHRHDLMLDHNAVVPVQNIILNGMGTLIEPLKATHGKYRIMMEGNFYGGICDSLKTFDRVDGVLNVLFEDPNDALLFKLTLQAS